MIRCIMLIPSVKGEKILEALSAYDNKFLYQKCGYILEQLQDELGLSNEFFEHLGRYTADGKRYLIKESGQDEDGGVADGCEEEINFCCHEIIDYLDGTASEWEKFIELMSNF